MVWPSTGLPLRWPCSACRAVIGLAAEGNVGAGRKQAAQARQRIAQLVAVDDHIDHAVGQEVFGLLEALGQLLADGLLDDAGAGEADQRPWLGDLHVAQHGVGGGDAAGGGIRQHDDVGQARFAQLLHGNGRARHLHEREDALLHARATGGRKQDEGRALLHRAHHAGDDGLARRHAERARHEAEVLGGSDDVDVVELALADEDCIVELGFVLGRLEAVGVALAVAELERILRHLGDGNLGILAAVEQERQPLLRVDAHVIVGARDDELVGLEILVEDHLPRLGALHPEVLRQLALGGEQVADLGTDDVVDPVHAPSTPPAPAWLNLELCRIGPPFRPVLPTRARMRPATSGSAQCLRQASYKV